MTANGGTTCDRPDLARLVTRYELLALDEVERGALERHVLECDACFQELERGALAAAALRARAGELVQRLRATPIAASVAPRRRSSGRAWRAQLLFPLFAVLLAGLGIRAWIEHQRDPARLATYPREAMPTELLRAPGMNDAVRELMQAGAEHFDLGHYEEAARRFAAALERDPELAPAAYALGLSLALAGDARAALAPLQKAARELRGGDQGRARWVLANAYLEAGMIAEAMKELKLLESETGEYALPARELRARLR